MAIINDLPKQSAPYRELAWIQGQGDQYIDLGFVPNGHTTFECKWNNMRLTAQGNTDMTIFGVRSAYNNNQFQLSDFTNSDVQGYFGLSRNSVRTYSLHYAGNTDIITTYRNGTLSTGTGYTYSIAEDSWNQTNRLYLFALNENGSIIEKCQYRLYYCKFWYNGNLFRDLIPVVKLSNSEICLYDKVTEMFYGNLGSGSFLGG